MADRKYLSCAETAKLLRQSLKESFPSIKFTVKSHVYSGGASIRVGWTDGPSTGQVQGITGMFEGAYFDGGIDYQGSRYHALDGSPVRFGANYIFEDREHSDAQVQKALDQVVNAMGGTEPMSVEDYRMGNTHSWRNSGGVDMSRQLNLALSDMSSVEAADSPTLGRVTFVGDDGYGQGTVGMPGDRGGNRGYPQVRS